MLIGWILGIDNHVCVFTYHIFNIYIYAVYVYVFIYNNIYIYISRKIHMFGQKCIPLPENKATSPPGMALLAMLISLIDQNGLVSIASFQKPTPQT